MHNPKKSGLDPIKDAFEQFGRQDPMYAACSRSGYEGGRWDPQAFFATGKTEIGDVLGYIAGLGVAMGRQRALDFGCALGRLTQALAAHYQEVVGVDIAESMLDGARSYNQYGLRVSYVLNTSPTLGFASDGSFDFVYSNKVLQHLPPEYQATYISEFLRVLRPRGIAVFQTRNGPLVKPGSFRAWLYRMNRRYVRRTLQRLKRRPAYEMHYIARSWVEEAVGTAGGEIVDVVDLSRGRSRGRGKKLRYCVRRR